MKRNNNFGLSATEIVFAVALFVILGITMVPDALGRVAASHDERRIADLERIQDAVEAYHKDHGVWPPAHENPEYGGWDVSQDGDFIPELVAKGYLAEMPADPLNDDAHHYRYRVFDEPHFGCKSDGPWYVLGIRAFETPQFAAHGDSAFKCSKRDFTEEFAWVVGEGASWR